MPRVTTISHKVYGKLYSYTINVTSEGEFTTTIDKYLAKAIIATGINLMTNRAKNYGYFSSNTIKGLTDKVNDVMSEYTSREIISENLIIRYLIDTSCDYWKNKSGEFLPNGSWDSDSDKGGWCGGTKKRSTNEYYPWGIQICLVVLMERDYKFRSGKIVKEYETITDSGKNTNIDWLNAMCGMGPARSDKYNFDHNAMQIEATEETALFFVNLLKNICHMNEAIKDHVDPKSIKKIIDSGGQLLIGERK